MFDPELIHLRKINQLLWQRIQRLHRQLGLGENNTTYCSDDSFVDHPVTSNQFLSANAEFEKLFVDAETQTIK